MDFDESNLSSEDMLALENDDFISSIEFEADQMKDVWESEVINRASRHIANSHQFNEFADAVEDYPEVFDVFDNVYSRVDAISLYELALSQANGNDADQNRAMAQAKDVLYGNPNVEYFAFDVDRNSGRKVFIPLCEDTAQYNGFLKVLKRQVAFTAVETANLFG